MRRQARVTAAFKGTVHRNRENSGFGGAPPRLDTTPRVPVPSNVTVLCDTTRNGSDAVLAVLRQPPLLQAGIVVRAVWRFGSSVLGGWMSIVACMSSQFHHLLAEKVVWGHRHSAGDFARCAHAKTRFASRKASHHVVFTRTQPWWRMTPIAVQQFVRDTVSWWVMAQLKF